MLKISRYKLFFSSTLIGIIASLTAISCSAHDINRIPQSEDELAAIRKQVRDIFKPEINYPQGKNNTNYFVYELESQELLNFKPINFKVDYTFNNQKYKTNVKLQVRDIRYSTQQSDIAHIYYEMRSSNPKLSGRQIDFIIPNFKAEQITAPIPFCHFGHCHPGGSSAQLIIIPNPILNN